ncbi:hypothetical protein AB3Y40_14965 [Yoonia sp. R2331]|uniref:hypothetical protein n=1 Tax=Yoonia sp. R2331 TaxID=3237238 RepID=UPI0034E37D29
MPVLDKDSIPALTALFLAFFALKRPNIDALQRWIPKSLAAWVMLVGLVAGAFLTVLTNDDRVGYLPGLRVYDGFSSVLGVMIQLIPFILAYRFLASPSQHRTLLMVLALAGLGYSLLALYEIRMSPQLNRMVYGFFPHDWIQHVRGGNFRPLVFLEHGLWLAIFFAMAAIAAVGASAAFPKQRTKLRLVAGWIFLTLLLSSSLGAAAIAFVLVPIVFFLPQRTQMLLALIIGTIVLTYPILRERGWVTGDTAVSIAASINADRAGSLQFRLENEDILLQKANQRPLFGWGGWGRARVYDELGTDISVTDGYWVIIFGVGGWTRYLSEFGLMIAPLVFFYVRRKRYNVGPETTTLTIVLCANLIDLLPNATMTPLTWLIAGALWGRMDWKGNDGSDQHDPEELVPVAVSPYTRQTKRIKRRQAI